jgi:hypothetical protein
LASSARFSKPRVQLGIVPPSLLSHRLEFAAAFVQMTVYSVPIRHIECQSAEDLLKL